MLLAGITDTEVHLAVCFAVMATTNCCIGVCAYLSKTDSIEKIQDGLFTPSCSILRSGFRETVAFLSSQSVIVDIKTNCCNSVDCVGY